LATIAAATAELESFIDATVACSVVRSAADKLGVAAMAA
jgi:hypothetical protein